MKKIALSVFPFAFAGTLLAAPIDSEALRGAPTEMDSFGYVDVDALRESKITKLLLKEAKEGDESMREAAAKSEKWLNNVSDIWFVQNRSATPANSAIVSARGKFTKEDIFEFVEENKLKTEKVGERTFFIAKGSALGSAALKGTGANVPENQEMAFVLLADGRFMGAIFDRQTAGEDCKDSAFSVLKKCVADYDEQKSVAVPSVPQVPEKAKEIIRLFVGEGLLKEVAGDDASPSEVRAMGCEIPVKDGAALYVGADLSFEVEEVAKSTAIQFKQGVEMLKLMYAMQQPDQPRTNAEEDRVRITLAILSGIDVSCSEKTVKFSMTTPEVSELSKAAASAVQGSDE